ncbi:MAG TPA: C4-type zinc ribbon domain-containing protein [Acidimicrobiales bacterium]|nr:C4-type zinc ribbon domain-containing protein [Acidimicrobiales bacterium]
MTDGEAAPVLSIYKDLLSVQVHDTAADRLTHRRATLPESARLAAVADALVTVEVSLAEAVERRDAAARVQRQLEDEMANVEDKIKGLDARLYSGEVTVVRELQAMQADTESLRRRHSALEDEVLEAMSVREPIDEEVQALEKERARLDDEGVELRAAIAEAQAGIDAELANETTARAETAARVPTDLLALYERIRANEDGIGAAPLVNGRCGGCHLTLPATELDRMKREPPDALVTCEQCGRVLVR